MWLIRKEETEEAAQFLPLQSIQPHLGWETDKGLVPDKLKWDQRMVHHV